MLLCCPHLQIYKYYTNTIQILYKYYTNTIKYYTNTVRVNAAVLLSSVVSIKSPSEKGHPMAKQLKTQVATPKSHGSEGQIMLRLNCNKESDNGTKAVITETIVFARRPFALDSSTILDRCCSKCYESRRRRSSRIPNPDRGACGGGGRVLWRVRITG